MTSTTHAQSIAQTERAQKVATAAVKLLQDWFGPAPVAEVKVASRWLTPVRDQSTERAVIAALVRQYWAADARNPRPFTESLVLYTSTRAIHELLEGSNFAAPRFFGDVVPFPLRSLLLSPQVADPRPRVTFSELDVAGNLRGFRALQSLERYVGWPTMLDAIATLRNTEPATWDVETFAAILSEIRGTDMTFLVKECFRPDARFDYALEGLSSHPSATGQIETSVRVIRRGARFASMPVRVRFADGREIRDAVDGASLTSTLTFTSSAPAVSAAVDPDVMLVLDDDRDNNAIVRDPVRSQLGVRLALHWLAWLQNTMLSYSALI